MWLLYLTAITMLLLDLMVLLLYALIFDPIYTHTKQMLSTVELKGTHIRARTHTHTHTHKLTQTLTNTHKHSQTLANTRKLSHTHTLTLTLTHTHTLTVDNEGPTHTLTHTHPLRCL